MQCIYKTLRYHGHSRIVSVSRLRFVSAVLLVVAPLGACATVSVYEPGASAEISLTGAQSQLHKASDAYCREAREKGLATGQMNLSSLSGVLTGSSDDANAYWRKIGADRSAAATVVSRVRTDMNKAASGLVELDKLARSVLGKTQPTRSDVTQFELALIHARQARDSFSDAFHHVNQRSDREYQITLELAPMDEALAAARVTADELAAARSEEKLAAAS